MLWALLRKEVLMEWRQRYAINGILLYVLSTVFIIYLAFIMVDPATWVSLLWIVLLFAAVNAVAKSFVLEGRSRLLYYYSMVSATQMLLAKMIYNVVLMLALTALTVLVFLFFLGNQVGNWGLFSGVLFLGSTGFALAFTLVSAIAAKGQNSATLMAVLSLPLVLPELLLVIRLSLDAVAGLPLSETGSEMGSLVALDALLLAVGYLLFPYLWRE